MNPARFAVCATGLVGLCVAVLHLSIFTRTPENADELIYQQLAENLATGRGYTLQGTPILRALPDSMYDHATFNHPPGFPLLLVPFASAGVLRWGVAVSLAASLAAATAIAALAWRYLLRDGDSPFRRMLFSLLLCAAFLDPLLSFCSRRIWMDNFLAAGVAWGAVGALLCGEGSRRWLVAGALALALAVATKVLAIVFVAPLMLAVACGRCGWRGALLYATPACLVLFLWEGCFHQATGAWLPHWLAIDPAVLARKPFMAGQVAQPWFYFPSKWLLLSPMAVGMLVASFPVARRLRTTTPPARTAWMAACGSAILYLGTLVILGARGFSKEARYLTPLEPLSGIALAASFAILWPGKATPTLRGQLGLLACALGIALGTASAGFYLLALQHDEPLSFWGLVAALARAP